MKSHLSLVLFIIIKLCTASALYASTMFDDPSPLVKTLELSNNPLIYDALAGFLYSDGISTKNDAKNYARLNEAAAGNTVARQALEGSYQNGHIQSLRVDLIAPLKTYVADEDSVADACIDRWARLHPKVTRLDFSHCYELTEETLTQWLIRFPNLTSLSLADNDNGDITDASLIAIAEHCKKLRELTLAGYDMGNDDHITDVGIIALAECKELRVVNLSESRNLTDAAVTILAENCKELREVNLSECRNLTDAAVFALVMHCKKLQQVNVSACPNITGAAANALRQAGIQFRGRFTRH